MTLISSNEQDEFPARFTNAEEFPTRSDDEELQRCAVENMCGDMHIKYLTFLRFIFSCLVLCIISKEAVEMEHEFILKIDEVGELFEEARGTLNKNVSTERVEAIYPLLKDVALSPDMPFCVDCIFEGL
ncbi:hypothetical protein F2Q69_00020578 [Brassica cretica]|uniref:Uncharacterized protein n=1 Tax=Brassica cretica TaxID=69181 RepID=A0A8S9Q8M3_BRACR|nr:hypothetical protein F2Q69_00020578 [Brassica cretica]